MRNVLFTLLTGVLAAHSAGVIAADKYPFSPEMDAHTMLMLQIDHQGFSRSIGFFKDFEGVITLDEDNIENSSVEVSIDMDSVDFANHEEWNTNTKKYFFNIADFPTMTYTSTDVKDLGDGNMEITGNLTLMGVTKPVVLAAKLNKIGPYMSEDGPIKAGFSATTSLNRQDFGIMAAPPIGSQVDITIEIEAFKEGGGK